MPYRNKIQLQYKPNEIRRHLNEYFNPLDQLLRISTQHNGLTKQQANEVFSTFSNLVKEIGYGMTPTQLRKLADIFVNPDRRHINKTRPKVALMIAKTKDVKAKYIVLLVDEMAKLAVKDETGNLAKGFPYFIEMLIAYHRFFKNFKDKSDSRQLTAEKLIKYFEENKTKQLVESIRLFVRNNYKGITSSQLRNIYDRIVKFESEQDTKERIRQINTLQPQLAYTAARQDNPGAKRLLNVFMELIAKSDNYQLIKKSLESIVGFHKYFETFPDAHFTPNHEELFDGFDELAILNMQNELDSYEIILKRLKEFIRKNYKGIKPSQIHRLHQEVSRATSIEDIQWLRPLFYYTGTRQKDNRARNIVSLFNKLAKAVESKEQVQGFKNISENIIAFHRFYEATSNHRQFIQMAKKDDSFLR